MTETDRRFAKQGDSLSDRARRDARFEASTPTPDAEELDTDAPDAEAPDADLRDSEARDADARDADLRDADLSGTDLSGTDPAFAADAASDAALAAGADPAAGPVSTPTPAPAPVSTPAPAPAFAKSAAPSSAEADSGPLLPEEDADMLRTRWQSVQAGFVDDPRQSVQEADALLEQVAVRFAQSLTEARGTLRDDWDGGNGAAGSAADDAGTSTEQLRGTLQAYRSLVNRLLDV